MSKDHDTGCDRRQFLCAAVRGAVACTVAGAAPFSAGCASIPRADATLIERRTLAVEVSAFEEGDGLLVHHSTLDDPVYVHRTNRAEDGGDFTAVLTTCTHRGCRAEPTGTRIVCPCHGSQFARDGQLLEGPADEPLVEFRTDVDHGTLLIRLDDEV